MKEDGSYNRHDFLHEAAKIPGLYVPAFYEVSYHEDGTIADFIRSMMIFRQPFTVR
mgnify:CR=1 FL=1